MNTLKRSRDAICTRAIDLRLLLSEERAQGCRVRAAPAVSCAVVAQANAAHEHTGEAVNTPAAPAQWLYGLLRDLPGGADSLSPSPVANPKASHELDASFRGVGTTRLDRTRKASFAL